jgi:hypothetical protein
MELSSIVCNIMVNLVKIKNGQNQKACRSKLILKLLISLFFCTTHFDASKQKCKVSVM